MQKYILHQLLIGILINSVSLPYFLSVCISQCNSHSDLDYFSFSANHQIGTSKNQIQLFETWFQNWWNYKKRQKFEIEIKLAFLYEILKNPWTWKKADNNSKSYKKNTFPISILF